jgi:hypothetical protein
MCRVEGLGARVSKDKHARKLELVKNGGKVEDIDELEAEYQAKLRQEELLVISSADQVASSAEKALHSEQAREIAKYVAAYQNQHDESAEGGGEPRKDARADLRLSLGEDERKVLAELRETVARALQVVHAQPAQVLHDQLLVNGPPCLARALVEHRGEHLHLLDLVVRELLAGARVAALGRRLLEPLEHGRIGASDPMLSLNRRSRCQPPARVAAGAALRSSS